MKARSSGLLGVLQRATAEPFSEATAETAQPFEMHETPSAGAAA